MSKSKNDDSNESALFFKKCISSPKTMGALAPSSSSLAKNMAKFVRYKPGQKILELGAGTGALTAGLLKSGVQEGDLYSIELDESLSKMLKHKFPRLNIIQGNALDLESIIPEKLIGNISTIVSGLPLMIFDDEVKAKIVNSCFSVLKSKGRLLQFTYGFTSPLPTKELNLQAKRLKYVILNLPPAFIWEFSKK